MTYHEPNTISYHPLHVKLCSVPGIPHERQVRIELKIESIKDLPDNHPAFRSVNLDVDLAIRDST